MPGFDGTGPGSKGPLTGRRLGVCRGTIGRISGNHRIMFPILGVAVMSAAVEDIRNPHGLLRRGSAFLAGAVKRRLQAAMPFRKELESEQGKCIDEQVK